MRDRDRTALLDLFDEQWHHAAVAAQDVAETNGGKDGVAAPRVFRHCLDAHFIHPFGRAHDIGGIDRFVRGDQNEALHVVLHRDLHKPVRTDDIVEHRFGRMLLHHWHMLIRGRVKHDFRRFLGENLSDRALVFDVGQCSDPAERGVRALQFHLDVVERAFVLIEQDDTGRIVTGNLPAELGTDGSARSGDQDALVLQ